MSDEPLLRGSGPTARERALGLTAVGALALAGLVQGLAADMAPGGGPPARTVLHDSNSRRAVVLQPGQTVLLGLETPQAQVLAAEVRPPPLHRRAPPSAPALVELAEAPPPALSATDAAADVAAVEAAPPVSAERLITPEAPDHLRAAR